MAAKAEIAISFDTTGSMASCIHSVRDNLDRNIRRVLAEHPTARFAIVAHGDYCDAEDTYVTKLLDFTTDVTALTEFVQSVEDTGGGDADECYELVLRKVRTELSWTPGSKRAYVLIGDCGPHDPDYPENEDHIDWKQEIQELAGMGIKGYAVHCTEADDNDDDDEDEDGSEEQDEEGEGDEERGDEEDKDCDEENENATGEENYDDEKGIEEDDDEKDDNEEFDKEDNDESDGAKYGGEDDKDDEWKIVIGYEVKDEDEEMYRSLAAETGGVYLKLSDLANISDLLVAICKHQQGPAHLEDYENEVRARQAGDLNPDMEAVFASLRQHQQL